jgi:hypothetical protein
MRASALPYARVGERRARSRAPAWAASLWLWAALAGPAHAGLTADSGRVYRGSQGELVEVVILSPPADGKAVLRFGGTRSELDGLALPFRRTVERAGEGERIYLTTTWRGREFSLLQADSRRGGERWELYVPGDLRRGRPVVPDEAASRALKLREVLAQHDKQQREGSLSRFASFRRGEEQAAQDKAITEGLAAVDKACGTRLAAGIVWTSVSDEQLRKYSIGSFCAPPLSAMAALCSESQTAAAILRDKVKEVRCTFRGPARLTVTAGRLDFAVDGDTSNVDELARQGLEGLEVAAPRALRGEPTPYGDVHTLGQRLALARTSVCTDGKGHYAASAPHAPGGAVLYYGDGKTLARVRLAELLGSGTFFEPRFPNPGANPDFRGADMRLFSAVEIDEEKRTCAVRCGTRTTPLRLLPEADATTLLTGATFAAPLEQRQPHALVRDDRGTYYYVDKGAEPDSEKRFRLYAGRKGNLRELRMVNVVADSQGEIFATRNGELRFIVGPGGGDALWVKGKVRTRLRAVPIAQNLPMIYNELGVYLGQKRGTPCDDL